MTSRPVATVRTHFEIFELFKFLDHTERTHLLHFSTHFDAQDFLRRIVEHADTGLLYRLWSEIESPVFPSHGNILDRLDDCLVSGRLKVKRIPLPRSELSAWEREYFTARFDELRAQKALASSSSTRSTLVPEVTPSPTPKDATSLTETPTVDSPSPTTSLPPTISESMTVAAIQMYSEDGKLQENLNTAEQLAREAKKTNSELDLILFPELTSPGYGVGPHEQIPEVERQQLAQDLWSAAEPSEQNQTLQTMQAVAKDLQVMIGVSFLESDGQDFFVTFVLLGRDGQELGRIRKRKAAAQEAYYVASDTDRSHVLTVTDSKLGTLKIGVGICYENYHIQLPCHFQQEGVDLVLQPHSANIMNLSGEPLAKLYATTLGVPVVMVNKYNPKMGFPGNSAIAYFDENGTFDMKDPKKETDNSSHEGEMPIESSDEHSNDEQKISFMATFPLKKKVTPYPLNCDSSVIGTKPQLWPEALIQFDNPSLEITKHFETFDILQEEIRKLENQLREAFDLLLKLKSLVDTQPSSWPEVHDPFSETPQRLETPEALQKTIAELEVQTETVLKEIEKLNLLKVSVGRIKGFFDEVETDGKNFYNEEYVKERKEWALDIVQEYANCLKRRIESSSKEKS